MAHLIFTQQLRRFIEAPEIETRAATLREALDVAFRMNPRLRGYIIDEQDHLRPNIAVFINGRRITDRTGLGDTLAGDSNIHVLQALTGG